MNSTLPPKVLPPNWNIEHAQSIGTQFSLDIVDSPYGPQTRLPNLSAQLGSDERFVAVLTDYSVLSISGQEAAVFLQGQLTNDVQALSVGEGQLSAFCTPKGRMLASGWLCRTEEHHYLWAVCTTLAASLQKRLGMFVMRAKAKVALEPDMIVLGSKDANNDTAIPLPSLGARACIAMVPTTLALERWNRDPSLQASSEQWRALELRAGVARITAHTSELFVPQMVNFELVGGVNFKKGCYPGQEIVARSQYLGKLKRRMYRVKGKGEVLPLPGSDVWSDAAEPSGQVVGSAYLGAQVFECLIETQTDSVAGALRAKTEAGETLPLELLDLPYEIVKIA